MFGSRVIEKNRKPSKFRDNQEQGAKAIKKQVTLKKQKSWQRESANDDINNYSQGC